MKQMYKLQNPNVRECPNVSKTSKWPIKFYIIILLILVTIVILYLSYLKQIKVKHAEKYEELDNSGQIFDYKESNFTGAKIVHLDLKGAPPKISYYPKLFPILSKLGATGILIEYEDMFPYNGPLLKNISALNAYSLDDINYINKVAAENNLEVIPLVQTFGHLEFVLKLEELKEFREIPESPQAICPTLPHTIEVLMEMIEQVVRAHPASKMIHIGADEVYHLGECDRCTTFMNNFNISKNILFLKHIYSITSEIQKKFPDLNILMWDDMFRRFTMEELRSEYFNKAIQPVVWKYAQNVSEEIGPSVWNLYTNTFPKVWIASAFKGAVETYQYVSDVTHYVQNHRSWMSIYSEYKERINFQGIIITGWQRYDHFAVLCELLPVSLPALAMSLRIIMGYKDSPLTHPMEVTRILGCEQPHALIDSAIGSPRCSFFGGDILDNVVKLHQLTEKFESIQDNSRVKGWLNEHNIAHVFSNPEYVIEITSSLGKIRSELIQVDIDITAAMDEIYDNYTISEFKETYLTPLQTQVNALWDGREKILSRHSWPRRPLTTNNEL